MQNVIIDGQAYLENCEVPFHFEDHKLTLYFERFLQYEQRNRETDAEEIIVTDENTYSLDTHTILVRKRGMLAGGYYLMHTEIPLTSYSTAPFPHTYSQKVDWYIDSFDPSAKYDEMKFRFDELSYFIPSTAMAKVEGNAYVFDRDTHEILSFNMNISGVDTEVKLVTYCNCLHSLFVAASANTISELRIKINPTCDYNLLYKLYHIVNDVFSFICNRRNISLEGAELHGAYECDGMRDVSSFLHVYDKYKESSEESREVSKTIQYSCFESGFAELMKLIAANYDKEGGTISLKGIHPSTKKRNLIDLRQSLNTTSAFEYHVRKCMPEISSEETIQAYEEIRNLISEQYIPVVTGKKRKIARDIVHGLNPMVSLGDKIRKAIKGYAGWDSLELIISKRFPNWDELADIANVWRNELAHDKRRMSPTADTIKAIRLVEHLNYAIILRTSGYSDEEIQKIIEHVLIV